MKARCLYSFHILMEVVRCVLLLAFLPALQIKRGQYVVIRHDQQSHRYDELSKSKVPYSSRPDRYDDVHYSFRSTRPSDQNQPAVRHEQRHQSVKDSDLRLSRRIKKEDALSLQPPFKFLMSDSKGIPVVPLSSQALKKNDGNSS